ncbi:hypothetical protein BU26DRAFT_519652 [Trematosphaeria pertusa]|uniref:RING-type domain-containing protein n=1 Tax=Trematosphaeria pertusa TaxID=390896 RepID=A0A6A6IC64_9PLEO|nr:uncharacterized protein BU26DRAFT_519652 [Trematosphaeria pertusa]KAF2247839.1 hypothetical protein BU26DRAFT_519652 [Trematosphaeria pertusa]
MSCKHTRSLILWSLKHLRPLTSDYKPPSSPSGCLICHESFNAASHFPLRITDVPGCPGHVFGATCLLEWITGPWAKANTCPLCRTVLLSASASRTSDVDSEEASARNEYRASVDYDFRIEMMRDVEAKIRKSVDLFEDLAEGFLGVPVGRDEGGHGGEQDVSEQNAHEQGSQNSVGQPTEQEPEHTNESDVPPHIQSPTATRQLPINTLEARVFAPKFRDATAHWTREERNETRALYISKGLSSEMLNFYDRMHWLVDRQSGIQALKGEAVRAEKRRHASGTAAPAAPLSLPMWLRVILTALSVMVYFRLAVGLARGC